MFDLGIKSVEERTGQVNFRCGCHLDPRTGTVGYLLVSCPENHFGQKAEENRRREHERSHKRRRKGCRYCYGVAA